MIWCTYPPQKFAHLCILSPISEISNWHNLVNIGSQALIFEQQRALNNPLQKHANPDTNDRKYKKYFVHPKRTVGPSHFQNWTILANFSQPNCCGKRLSAAPTSSLADVLNLRSILGVDPYHHKTQCGINFFGGYIPSPSAPPPTLPIPPLGPQNILLTGLTLKLGLRRLKDLKMANF